MIKTEAINTVITVFVLALVGAIVIFFGDILALSGPSDVMLGRAETEQYLISAMVGMVFVVVISTTLFMVDKRREEIK